MVWPLEAMSSLTAELKVSKEPGEKIYLGQMVGKEVSPVHFFPPGARGVWPLCKLEKDID